MANTKDMTVFRGRQTETHGKKDLTGATAAYTLSTDEAMYYLVEFFGAITADKVVTFPAVDGLQWVVVNSCTGAHTLSVQVQGGAKLVPVGQGAVQPVYCDGAEFYPLASAGNQASASASAGDLIGISTSPSFALVSIDSGTTAVTLTPTQATGFFLEFHNAHNGVVTVQFPATEGRFWIIRCAADSLFAVRCFAAGSPGTFVDVNPGYDGLIVVDDALTMTQVLVKHGNTHAAAGSDPTTNLMNPSALGTGTADATVFLRGDQTWTKAERSLTGYNHQTLTNASTTLTGAAAAKRFQHFSASAGGKSVVFPTTGFVGGDDWIVYNNSSFPLTIQFGAGDLGTILARGQTLWVCVDQVTVSSFFVLGALSDGFGGLIVNGVSAFAGTIQGLENGLSYPRASMSGATTTGNYTLPRNEYEGYYIKVTTALTGNLVLIFPNTQDGATWVVENLSSGAFTVTAKVTSDTGAGVVIGQGKRAMVSCSGTAMVRLTDDTPKSRGYKLTLCSGFTPAGTGADLNEYVIPYDPSDGATSITWTMRRATLRVGTAGGAPVCTIEKSSAGDAAFSSPTTIATLTMTSGHNRALDTTTVATVVSGDIVRMNPSALGTATAWTVELELGAP